MYYTTGHGFRQEMHTNGDDKIRGIALQMVLATGQAMVIGQARRLNDLENSAKIIQARVRSKRGNEIVQELTHLTNLNVASARIQSGFAIKTAKKAVELCHKNESAGVLQGAALGRAGRDEIAELRANEAQETLEASRRIQGCMVGRRERMRVSTAEEEVTLIVTLIITLILERLKARTPERLKASFPESTDVEFKVRAMVEIFKDLDLEKKGSLRLKELAEAS